MFTISVIPKKYFHDILSHHCNELFQVNDGDTKQIQNNKFNCGFVNSAAITPFLESGCALKDNPPAYNNYLVAKTAQPVFATDVYRFLLRGTPLA